MSEKGRFALRYSGRAQLEDADGNRYVAQFPAGVVARAQYGTTIKTHAVYMSQFQLIPYDRVRDHFTDQFQIPLSAGTLYNVNQQAYQSLEQFDQWVKFQLTGGAFRDDDNGVNSGSAYVYVRDIAGVWIEQQKLTASDGSVDDWLGYSVAVSGNTAIGGAIGDADAGNDAGSAYLFSLMPSLTSPTSSSTLAGTTETFQWTPSAVDVTHWWFYLGSQSGTLNYYNSGLLSAGELEVTVENLPMDGSTLYARLWYRINGDSSWHFADYTFAALGNAPMLNSPVPGSQLDGETQVFTWLDNSTGATSFWLYAGSEIGQYDYVNSGNLAAALSHTLTGLPTDGTSPVYLRLWYRVGSGPWLYTDATYTAGSSLAISPVVIDPAPDSTLSGATENFSWTDNGSGATQYWGSWGSVPGGVQYGSRDLGSVLSTTLNNMPVNGSSIWFRLWYRASSFSPWQFIDTAYTAIGTAPMITSHSSGDTLSSPTDTFTWTDPTGTVGQYWVYIGSTAGGLQYDDSGNLGALTSYASNQQFPASLNALEYQPVTEF